MYMNGYICKGQCIRVFIYVYMCTDTAYTYTDADTLHAYIHAYVHTYPHMHSQHVLFHMRGQACHAGKGRTVAQDRLPTRQPPTQASEPSTSQFERTVGQICQHNEPK